MENDIPGRTQGMRLRVKGDFKGIFRCICTVRFQIAVSRPNIVLS